MQKGLLSTVGEWFSHPLYSNGTVSEWLAALVMLIIISFLWSTVVNQID